MKETNVLPKIPQFEFETEMIAIEDVFFLSAWVDRLTLESEDKNKLKYIK